MGSFLLFSILLLNVLSLVKITGISGDGGKPAARERQGSQAIWNGGGLTGSQEMAGLSRQEVGKLAQGAGVQEGRKGMKRYARHKQGWQGEATTAAKTKGAYSGR